MTPNMALDDYSSRIRRLRAALGLTQARLAEALGVSFTTVNRWEGGHTHPSALAWRRIVRAEELGFDGFEPERESPVMPAPSLATDVPLDFGANPAAVWAAAEGHRLAYGHLFNPAFATETSLIDPLPHQRIAVYDRMLPQTRLRFLLADDAGAGKTIMAGLYIREMLSRRLIRRVLIVPPAGLVGNWERELRTLFRLPFTIVSGADAQYGNPFVGSDSDFVIVSIDTLAGERMFGCLQEATVLPYDLIVFDESHKLSADRQPDGSVRRTDRYRLAEALAGIPSSEARWSLNWAAHHILLLTATPHMGKDIPYFYLWRLLEPEALPTFEALQAYPPDARSRHFIRRTKEEMVRFDGSRIYPTRVSDTLSYDLASGEVSEQRLYDETTDYIRMYYNRARVLNRSAARLAMSVFQRRLASSTHALARSFERRLKKLDDLIEAIRSGSLKPDELLQRQRRLDDTRDVLEDKTADEERAQRGQEENEITEEELLGGVVAVSLTELQAERGQVERLQVLARQVLDLGQESKFDRLREILADPRYKDQKILIFTEYRDTLAYLVRRLEGLGFAGRVASIHGSMHYLEREAQVEFFRRPAERGGATYMVCTDAAGEGINLQFCWLMLNYDIPWNPARLEQRMGRIHRYKQEHDPVYVLNLVAGKTREGKVLKTLLDKLERIRKELGSDKVFDVIGRLFEGVSLKDYMERSLSEAGSEDACRDLDGRLTKEQINALRERERSLFGDGGEIAMALEDQRAKLAREELRRLLPGYVQRFVERAAPLVDVDLVGDPNGEFQFKARQPFALDPLWPVLEAYPPAVRERLTVHRPESGQEVVFLRPGEAVFDRFRALVCDRLGRDALRGGVFVDPHADRPYLFHLALVSVVRRADPSLRALSREEGLEYRLVGVRQEEGGTIEECPVERLLLLKAGHGAARGGWQLAREGTKASERAQRYLQDHVALPMVDHRRAALLETVATRADFVRRGHDYQAAELAGLRSRLAERARGGDARAEADLAKLKVRQRALTERREEALAIVTREPELIEPDEIAFLAHALVVPSADPEDRRRYDAEVEAAAVREAVAHEEGRGAKVRDVSTPARALAAGLSEHPGFDLLSIRAPSEERAIEVKGRVGVGDIELTDNEWAKACNLRDRYWLYVVFDCGTPRPRLFRVRDPFRSLLFRAKGGVLIDEKQVLLAAVVEEN